MKYRVEIKPSGHRYELPAGETVLAGAIEASINLPYGCKNGACGACKGKIIAGQVDYGEYQASTLTEEEKQNGYALFCSAKPLSDLVIECREVSELGSVRPKIVPVRLQTKEKLNHDVMAIYLKLPSHEKLHFMAGQYIEFITKDGLRRAFSLANPPHQDEFLELHIRHVDGGKFTDYVFNQMPEKTILRIEGPLGSFFYREGSQKPIIFLAAGTGFAPIKGIIEHLIFKGIDLPMTLYWGVKSLEDFYLLNLPKAWANMHPNFKFIPVLSEPKSTDGWTGRTGNVHQALLEDMSDFSKVDVYACGAPAMVQAAFNSLHERGLPPEAFFSDAFTYAKPAPNVAK
jgi:CDP-4-dehydro-6-deoxyglucose reductase, E3